MPTAKIELDYEVRDPETKQLIATGYTIMIQEALLKIIICPKCQSELEYNKEEYNLKCTNCEAVYRIENDIPIMIIEEKNDDG